MLNDAFKACHLWYGGGRDLFSDYPRLYGYALAASDTSDGVFMRVDNRGFKSVFSLNSSIRKRSNEYLWYAQYGKTATFLIANLKLKDGSTKKVLVTRENIHGEVEPFVHYIYKNYGYINPFGFKYSLNQFKLDLFYGSVEKYFHNEYKKVFSKKLPYSKELSYKINTEHMPWLNTFTLYYSNIYELAALRVQGEVHVLDEWSDLFCLDREYFNKYKAVFDKRDNAIVVVQVAITDIDLNCKGMYIGLSNLTFDIETPHRYYDMSQGEKSKIVFLDYDDPFNGEAWKPSCKSKSGIVKVKHPKLDGLFYPKLYTVYPKLGLIIVE